jgi:DNA repair protein RecO (recombination protein O)
MLRRTEGIVLKTIVFGEADLIVTYLTPDVGLLKVFAKSPRKTKSRFGSSLEPLTQARIAFWGKEDAALPRLTQSDILRPFQSIRDIFDCFLQVSQLIELTLVFMPERDVNRKVYSLLFQTLAEIESGGLDKGSPLANHYRIRLLDLVGFAPKLDACGRCGRSGFNFYISHGSVLCETCSKGIDAPVRITPAVCKLYHDLLHWDTSKIKRIKPSKRLLVDLSDIMGMHIRYILEKPMKSDAFSRIID